MLLSTIQPRADFYEGLAVGSGPISTDEVMQGFHNRSFRVKRVAQHLAEEETVLFR
jgi:hypothetical protein